MTQFNKIKVTNKLHNAAIFNVDVDSKSQRMFMTKTLDILGSQMYTTKRKQHKSRDAGTERKYHNFRPISDLPRLSNIFGYRI